MEKSNQLDLKPSAHYKYGKVNLVSRFTKFVVLS